MNPQACECPSCVFLVHLLGPPENPSAPPVGELLGRIDRLEMRVAAFGAARELAKALTAVLDWSGGE